jgi:hypothetical protein
MMLAGDRKSEVAEEMEAEIEYREEDYELDERAMREDLNQGINTGTHDFTHRGVNWPPSYRIRGNSHSKSADTAADLVNEASQESFPASDAPSWTAVTGEKDNQLEVEPAQEGCATSFIMGGAG